MTQKKLVIQRIFVKSQWRISLENIECILHEYYILKIDKIKSIKCDFWKF